jgi:hypothetical protein
LLSDDDRYEPVLTIVSMLVAIIFVYMGLLVASWDQFFGKDQEERCVGAAAHTSLPALPQQYASHTLGRSRSLGRQCC